MKKFLLEYNKALGVFSVCAVLLSSCTYKEVVDTNVTYPDQTIYLAQASGTLNSGGNGLYYPITPNIQDFVARFSIDKAAAKINVPIGVIRSGIDLSGSVQVAVAANTDTVTKMITAGKFLVTTDPTLTTEILPATAFTLPTTVTVDNGSTNATFILALDYNFFGNSLTNTPKKRYAIGVAISNASSKTIKSGLTTAIIFIDPTAVILPVANFSNNIDKITKTANFVNTSANSVSYSWSYGDGSAVEATVSPSHKYAASGTYTVALTATGVTGATIVKTTNITIP